jgi:hypothetical protein
MFTYLHMFVDNGVLYCFTNAEGNSEQRVEGDTLVGICGIGKMYVIRNANLMKSTSDNS